MKRLSERLSMVAGFVEAGSLVADIGTDHAFLPCFLVENGVCPRAIAADLRRGPLENARKTVEERGLTDKISLRLSDGLDEIQPDEADTVIIAGMGGNLIADIIGRAEWLRDGKKSLVLQPMTHAEDVRACLFANGFAVSAEEACCEDGKAYICIGAHYSGKIVEHPSLERLYGGKLMFNGSAAAEKWLKGVAKRLEVKAEGIRGENPELSAGLYDTAQKILRKE